MANPDVFFGLGANYKYDKDKDTHHPGFVAEISGAIPKTPLQGWLQLQGQINEGKLLVNPTAFIGYTNKF